MARSTVSRSTGTSVRRRLSQNFLTDPAVAAWITREAAVGRDDLVIEIGPGSGMLTRALARRAGAVRAYELDGELARRLNRVYRDDHRVRCEHTDFLRVRPPSRPFKIVANIPYARTSAIVDWCLAARTLTDATLVTQLEYARKRTGGYGRWSLVTVRSWPRFSWRLLGRIDRHRFHPVPRTHGGLLSLTRRERPLLPVDALADYDRFVTCGFGGVGGSLYASLRARHRTGPLGRAFTAAGVDRRTPVGHVHADQWIRLFAHLRRL